MEYNIEYAGYLTVTGAHLVDKQGSEGLIGDEVSFAGQFRSNVTVVASDLDSALAAVRAKIVEGELQIAGFEGVSSFEHIWISRAHQRFGDAWVEVWESDREEESWIRIG